MRILIDPGHGGTDPGAVNGEIGLRESRLALAYGKHVGGYLAAAGHRVTLTREGDIFVSLPERVAIARRFKADLFLSIHLNSAENPDATGFEIWTSVGQTRADDFASSIFREIHEAFPLFGPRADWRDGDPDREKNYYVLRKTSAPAVLVELGFICNTQEASWIASPEVMDQYSRAIALGVGRTVRS